MGIRLPLQPLYRLNHLIHLAPHTLGDLALGIGQLVDHASSTFRPAIRRPGT